VDVPVELRADYNKGLEQLHRMCLETDQKLQMLVAVLKQEDIIKKVVGIVSGTTHVLKFLLLTWYLFRYARLWNKEKFFLQRRRPPDTSFPWILCAA